MGNYLLNVQGRLRGPNCSMGKNVFGSMFLVGLPLNGFRFWEDSSPKTECRAGVWGLMQVAVYREAETHEHLFFLNSEPSSTSRRAA